MSAVTTREEIVEAADLLFYQQGYDHTSFADIAGVVGLSRGNFYYHFRTKDEILDAVINRRLNMTREMLAQWEGGEDSPADRIRCFIHILIRNQAMIMLYGCPAGTLSTELAKLGHALHDRSTAIFTLFRAWLRQQFILLGRREDADFLAMHVLAHSQGVATLASAFQDESFIATEVDEICRWLELELVLTQAANPGASWPDN